MSSIEPRRTAAYSTDLRWRMVYQIDGLQFSYSKVAQNLGVDVSTVKRVLKTFRRTGVVAKKTYPKDKSFRKITTVIQFFILDLTLRMPGIYLHEIQKQIIDEFGITIDVSNICRVLHKSGFSYQKLRLVAAQRDKLLRLKYMVDVQPRSAVSLHSRAGNSRVMFVPHASELNATRECSKGYTCTRAHAHECMIV